MNCPRCGGPTKPLFHLERYCVRECDLKPAVAASSVHGVVRVFTWYDSSQARDRALWPQLPLVGLEVMVIATPHADELLTHNYGITYTVNLSALPMMRQGYFGYRSYAGVLLTIEAVDP